MSHANLGSHRYVDRKPTALVLGLEGRPNSPSVIVSLCYFGRGEAALSEALETSLQLHPLRKAGTLGAAAELERQTELLSFGMDVGRAFSQRGVYTVGMVLPVADLLRMGSDQGTPMTTFDLAKALFGRDLDALDNTRQLLNEYVLSYHPEFR